MKNIHLALALATALFCALPAAAKDEDTQKRKQPTAAELSSAVRSTIAEFKKADPGMDRFFTKSIAYVVFPRIGKAGFIIGGGDGVGEVHENGKVVGTVILSFMTVGLQAGAQDFSEVIFLNDRAVLDRLKANKFEFAASVSAVIVKSGASEGVDYRDGVAVFTKPKGGAMLEAAIGGQKFNFTATGAAAKK
jgi:lipid-binding SYLF domain-containing protein